MVKVSHLLPFEVPQGTSLAPWGSRVSGRLIAAEG